MEHQRILVLGCGGVGGVVAAKLSQAGRDVSVVTNNARIADAVNANGLTASFNDEIYCAKIPAYERFEPKANVIPFSVVIAAVPPTATVEAIQNALPYAADDAAIIILSNGLMEDHVVDSGVDPNRVVGGIVGFGAKMLGPGRVAQTAVEGVTFGMVPAATDRRALDVAFSVFEEPIGAYKTDNLSGVRWSKLAINCAISSMGTIGGNRLGVLMRHRFVRRFALEVMTEVVQVAIAEGVSLEKVSGTLDLEWLALTAAERRANGSPGLFAKHSVLLAVGAKFRNMRSSMLAAIERGREPSVAFLNGEIVTRAKKHGIAVPANQSLLDGVMSVSNGDMRPSIATLRTIFSDRENDSAAS